MNMFIEMLKEKAGKAYKFARSPDHRKTVMLIIIASIILAAAFIGAEIKRRQGFILDSKGRVTELIREDTDKADTYNLKIRASEGGKTYERDVVVTVKGSAGRLSKGSKRGQPETDGAAAKMEALERAVSTALSQVESGKGKRIRLPTKTEDGISLTWRSEGSSGFVFIVLLPFLLFAAYYENEKQKANKIIKARRESVKRMLPSFNDQLLLLLNSGMVLSDAFATLAEGYGMKKKKEYFEEKIIKIEERAETEHKSIAAVMSEEAAKMDIREFSRLSTVIGDSMYRGVDICSKLEADSSLLWQLRKNNAEAGGKLAETKMTIPLALLLFVLIVVTTAPALIQVEGG